MSGEAVTVAIRVRPFNKSDPPDDTLGVRMVSRSLCFLSTFYRLINKSTFLIPPRIEKRSTRSTTLCGPSMALRSTKTESAFQMGLALSIVTRQKLGICWEPEFSRKLGAACTPLFSHTARLALESRTLSLDTATILVSSLNVQTNSSRELRETLMQPCLLKFQCV